MNKKLLITLSILGILALGSTQTERIGLGNATSTAQMLVQLEELNNDVEFNRAVQNKLKDIEKEQSDFFQKNGKYMGETRQKKKDLISNYDIEYRVADAVSPTEKFFEVTVYEQRGNYLFYKKFIRNDKRNEEETWQYSEYYW